MPRHASRKFVIGVVAFALLALIVTALGTPSLYWRRDVPAFRVLASNHQVAAMGTMPCSEASPTLTPKDRCLYYYHLAMHRVCLAVAEAKGEEQVVLGKKYRR